MRRRTDWRGGLQDRRPGYQGAFKSPTYAIFHEYATRLTYCNVTVRMSLMMGDCNFSRDITLSSAILTGCATGVRILSSFCDCMQVSWSKDRPEWRGIFGGKPHSIQSLVMTDFSVIDHAVTDSGAPQHLLQDAFDDYSLSAF